MADLQTQPELETDFIRRVVAYAPATGARWFGRKGIMRSIAHGVSWLTFNAHQLYAQMIRRRTLRGSKGEDLLDVAAEYGAEQKGAVRSKVLVAVIPITAVVTAVDGTKTKIEVDDSTGFSATQSIRIRNGDGTTTDVRTISSITSGTGPNSGDELVVTALTGTYLPSSDDVQVALRLTISAESDITTSAGVGFQTLSELVTGDANPVLTGAPVSMSLSDLVWCECTEAGEVGNIEPESVTDFSPTIAGVASIVNAGPGYGGTDIESDPELKYRAAHTSSMANQETLAWLEALLQDSSYDVLRAVPATSSRVGVMAARVLHRNGGTFSTADLTAMEDYVTARVRSHLVVELSNVVLTAVAIEARITKDANAVLRDIGIQASSDAADYLDLRQWLAGQLVDNADLIGIINNTPGVATVATDSFVPSADVVVASDSYPVLVSLSLLDTDSGEVFNGTFSVGF